MSLFDSFFKRKRDVVGKEAGIDPALNDVADEQEEQPLMPGVEPANDASGEVNESAAPEIKPADSDNATGNTGVPLWWKAGNFVEAEKEYQKRAMENAENRMKRARRQRNAALLSDLANVFMQSSAKRGGVWKIDKMQSESAEANERMNALYLDRSKQAERFAERMMQAKQKDREEENAIGRYQTEREEKAALEKAKADAQQKRHEEKMEAEKAKADALEEYRAKQLRIQQQRADAYRKYIGRGGSKDDAELWAKYAEIVAEYPEYRVMERKEKKMGGVGTGEFINEVVEYPDATQMRHVIARYEYDRKNGKLKERESEIFNGGNPLKEVIGYGMKLAGDDKSPFMSDKKRTATW